jgi:hypothetical protein
VKLKIHVDFDRVVMYKYNVYDLKDAFNKKYFKQKYIDGSLKNHLGVKTKKEADQIVEDIVHLFFEELFDHLYENTQINYGKGAIAFICEYSPQLRPVNGSKAVNLAMLQREWLNLISKKAYSIIPTGKYREKIDANFDENTGIKWKLPQTQ